MAQQMHILCVWWVRAVLHLAAYALPTTAAAASVPAAALAIALAIAVTAAALATALAIAVPAAALAAAAVNAGTVAAAADPATIATTASATTSVPKLVRRSSKHMAQQVHILWVWWVRAVLPLAAHTTVSAKFASAASAPVCATAIVSTALSVTTSALRVAFHPSCSSPAPSFATASLASGTAPSRPSARSGRDAHVRRVQAAVGHQHRRRER
jgi:hypothetical protein